MARVWAAIAFVIMSLTAAAAAAPDMRYRPVASDEPLKDANFYLLTLLDADDDTRAYVEDNAQLRAIDTALRQRIRAAARVCEARIEARGSEDGRDFSACTIDAARWTEAERTAALEAAGDLFDKHGAVRRLVRDHLRPSGYYELHGALGDRALFLAAWTDAHAAIDRIVRVYGHGETPRFADIDSAIYPVDGRYYQGLMANVVRDLEITMPAEGAAHDLPLRLALDLMDINRRDDAVRMRALENAENAKTYARIPSIDWSRYPYAVILIPGYSPEVAFEPLNPGAKLRIKRGVEMYRAGKAPLLVVSGGTLRPVGTTVTEALEMKKHLMAEYGVAEDAILIDPIARHTTTNVRNTARLIYRHGIPADKKSLIAGNSVPYIASDTFRERCLRELGYVPFETFDRVSFDGLEWKPVPAALHVDATDPMDP